MSIIFVYCRPLLDTRSALSIAPETSRPRRCAPDVHTGLVLETESVVKDIVIEITMTSIEGAEVATGERECIGIVTEGRETVKETETGGVNAKERDIAATEKEVMKSSGNAEGNEVTRGMSQQTTMMLKTDPSAKGAMMDLNSLLSRRPLHLPDCHLYLLLWMTVRAVGGTVPVKSTVDTATEAQELAILGMSLMTHLDRKIKIVVKEEVVRLGAPLLRSSRLYPLP